MSSNDHQSDIDAQVLTYYGEMFDESTRLTRPFSAGALELRRTLEIVQAHFAGGRIIDIGGGPGRLARVLLDGGDSVELIDPVPTHIEQAAQLGITAQIGDARELPFADDTFDAALLLGPLYHLRARAARLAALREAVRVTRPGGLVFAGAITRFGRFSGLYLDAAPFPAVSPDLIALLTDGTSPPGLRFPAGHFHTAAELRLELQDADLDVREVVGVEGPAWRVLEVADDASPELVDAALLVAQHASNVPSVRELSAHLLAVGVVRPTR